MRSLPAINAVGVRFLLVQQQQQQQGMGMVRRNPKAFDETAQ
jgi:hypothetical protein